MRPAQKSNRSRGRGNRKGGGGSNNVNRVYDSAGPEGKVRGTPQQIIDKYLTLARDAQTSGDRVTAENFLQHAEHYQRILIQANAAQEQARREQQDAATDSRGDDQQQQSGVDHGAGEQPAQTEAPSTAPIGGMDMIDSGAPEQPLIVDAEEDAKPQRPRRNGDGRRRKPAPEAKAEPADPEQAPEASAEG